MAVNLKNFAGMGKEMAILSKMFKQTAEQLAEQNTASQLIDEIEAMLDIFEKDLCRKQDANLRKERNYINY